MFFKFLLLPIFALGLCVTSCGDDEEAVNDGLRGWYTNLNAVAEKSDFDEINEAIYNGELLSSYKYGGERHDYIAFRSLFIDGDGHYNDTSAYFGRLRFSIQSFINVIHIIDSSTLLFYIAHLCEDGASSADAVYKLYAGPVFRYMTYYGTPSYYTYTRVDNKIIVSNGDIYTVANGGLIKDGGSSKWSKYDPSKVY